MIGRRRARAGIPSLALILMATAAWVHGAPAHAADADPAASDAPSTPGATQVEEITVTADKRKESLEQVPVAVTAVTAQTAAEIGLTDVSSIQTAVPGLEFPRLFSGSTPTLRGVGTNFGIGGEESVVAIYVDDVYIASPSATTFSFNNISQIEVLKGPQGTLFGRNAMGGVIDITTRSPSQTPVLDVSAGYANYETYSGSIYASTPITDKLAADIAISGNDQVKGWGKNLYTGKDAFTEHDFNARSKWIYKPTDKTTITFEADFSRTRYDEGIAMRPVQGALFPDGQGYEGFYNVDENVTAYVDTKQGGVSGKIDQDLGWAHLISITAWRESHAFNNSDEDQSILPEQYLPINDNLNSVTEELRLVSQDWKNLHWLAGFFFYYGDSFFRLMDSGTSLAPLTLNEMFDQKVDSYAGFGQATYDLPLGFHLTGGVRYTYDQLSEAATEQIGIDLANAQSTTEGAVTYKVNLDKDITRNISAYFGYSTGFKSGIFNDQDIFGPPVKPETLKDLEGGIKSELFDHTLRLNLAVYHYNYDNLQLTSLTRAATGQTSATLTNAAAATNTGVELDFEAHPTGPLTLRGGFEAMHSRFVSFPDATISVPLPGGGNTTIVGNAAGLATPHSPDFSANLGGEYKVTTARGDVVGALNYSYSSSFAWDPDNRLKQAPYSLLNGSIRWNARGGRWDLTVWAKNITGTQYSIYTTANVVGDEESPAPPRTFGFTVSRHFD
jgi:iron complex outermembrane receptor protein